MDDLLKAGLYSVDDLLKAGVNSVDDLVKVGVNSLDDLAKVGVSSADDFVKGGVKSNYIDVDGNPSTETLKPGTLIDRYGYDGGAFVSPKGYTLY